MSQALPDTVDAWRMVQARRHFSGVMPLSALPRLAADLANSDGDVRFELEFGTDEFGTAFLHVRADAALPLVCQRTLDAFVHPAHVDARLGLITREEDEAGLPPGYEPLLIGDGSLHPADVVEDELILAVPLVPVKPGSKPVERSWGDEAAEQEQAQRPNPFAALKNMKGTR